MSELDQRLAAFVGRGGDKVTVARGRVTAEAIRQATDTVGDRNPAYSDADFAAESAHGTIVATAPSVLWWHRGHFEPVDSAERVDADGVRRFRLDPNPIRQAGMKENELGLLADMMKVLADDGFSSLAVTSSETTVYRYPRVGDLLSCYGPMIESVVGPKKTSLGMGYFSTSTYSLQDEQGQPVASWRTTRLHFAPGEK